MGPQGVAGPAGATGATGATGPAGSGTSTLSGSGAPDNALGNNGDFYIDTTGKQLYGPKVNGVWPASGIALGGGGSTSTPVLQTAVTGRANSTNQFGFGSSTAPPSWIFWGTPTHTMESSVGTFTTDGVNNTLYSYFTAVTPGHYRMEMTLVCVGLGTTGSFAYPIIDINPPDPQGSSSNQALQPTARAIFGGGAVGATVLPPEHRGRSQVVGTRYLQAGDKVYFRAQNTSPASNCPLTTDGTTHLSIIKQP